MVSRLVAMEATGTVPGMDGRQLISSGSPYELTVGYSRAVRVGDRVVVAGTAPQWPDGTVDPDPAAQARRCFEIIGRALEDAGASFADVVRSRVYLIDAGDFAPISGVHGEVFSDVRPAHTTVVVAALLDPQWKVEIEVEAVVATDSAAR
jgi:enamine deaminase RidA (YjgF/YER057c/UK114 family)